MDDFIWLRSQLLFGTSVTKLSIFTMFYGVISLYKMSRENLYNTKIKKENKMKIIIMIMKNSSLVWIS